MNAFVTPVTPEVAGTSPVALVKAARDGLAGALGENVTGPAFGNVPRPAATSYRSTMGRSRLEAGNRERNPTAAHGGRSLSGEAFALISGFLGHPLRGDIVGIGLQLETLQA